MIFDPDVVPGCTNVALHKFSNDPGLSFKPKSTPFANSVLLYKNIYNYIYLVYLPHLGFVYVKRRQERVPAHAQFLVKKMRARGFSCCSGKALLLVRMCYFLHL